MVELRGLVLGDVYMANMKEQAGYVQGKRPEGCTHCELEGNGTAITASHGHRRSFHIT
jgi:hypothetical protein